MQHQIFSFPSKHKRSELSRPALPIIAEGQAAWARLNKDQNWTDWKPVGQALEFGRAECMAQARANKPRGRRYNTAFHDWLERHGFAGISKSTRADLLKCMASLEAIEAWRATLLPDDLIRFNHPTTVLRAWRKPTKPATNGKSAPGGAPPPTIAEVKRLVVRLLEADLATLVGDLLHDRPDHVPLELRERLVRLQQPRDDIASLCSRIAELCRKAKALLQHPEQHRDQLHKIVAEISHAVKPKAKTAKIAIPPDNLDRTAFGRAMGLTGEKGA